MAMTTIVTVCLLASYVAASAGVYDQIAFLQSSNSTLLRYPTQYTQGIMPKTIHSHNDYWREVPMLTAISYGVVSVEADVWLVNGTLFVGHEIAALSRDRTLDALYIQPLLAILQAQNPATEFNTNRSIINGVFDTASSTALQLFIDIKTDGEEAWQPVLEALEPLREKGYLTTFKDGELTKSAVTVIGTGNTPLDGVLAQDTRDIFYDAPLIALKTDGACTYDSTISVVASTNYDTAIGWKGLGKMGDAQLANLTRFVEDAHECNLTARFWNTPDWPIYARNKVWKELLEAGADWLNADDLEAASEF